jgi:cell division inhibitor SepF
MSALQKLKAYFGMVPADELDDYDEDDRYGGYGSAYQSDGYDYDDRIADRVGARRRPLGSPRPVSRLDTADDFAGYDDRPRAPRRPWADEPVAPPHRPSPPVRGALAVEPDVEPLPMARPRPPVPEPTGHPLSRITTLHPRTFVEARTIGERYRDGAPVIINLTGMSDADARRLVDFSAGLAFAMRGDIDKITNKVFLISPPDIDVTAEDRRRIAEGGFFS